MIRYLPFASSVILGVAFINYHLGFLVLFGLIPIVIFVQYTKFNKSSLLTLWLAGVSYFALVMSWLLKVDHNTWVGISTGTASVLSVVAWLIAITAFGLAWPMFAIAAWRLQQLTKSMILNGIFLAASWTVVEY